MSFQVAPYVPSSSLPSMVNPAVGMYAAPYVPAAGIPSQSGSLNPPGGTYGLYFNQPHPNYNTEYAWLFGGPQALACAQCPPGQQCAGCPYVTPGGFVTTGNAPPVQTSSGLSLNQASTLFANPSAQVGGMPAWGWIAAAIGGLIFARGMLRKR